MKMNYSSFFLKADNSLENCLTLSNPKQLDNKIWEWNNVSTFQDYFSYELAWIDLIKNKKETLYGQTYSVKLWVIKNSGIIVFTSSLSTLNSVRQFLKDEFIIQTTIYDFPSEVLQKYTQNPKFTINQAFIKDKNEIISVNLEYLNKINNYQKIFAISIIISILKKKVNVIITNYGLVKISFGINDFDFMEIYHVLNII